MTRRSSGAAPLKAQDVTTAVLRTADVLRRRVVAALAPHGVTSQQYNVLRILRGAHPRSLATLEVAARMIEQAPGITRLLDRLETMGLVRRERGTEDRRLVECAITAAGLELLSELDAPIEAVNQDAVQSLSASDRRSLIRLLGAMRDGE